MMKKIQYLDLLRIYAALCVIMLHCIAPHFSDVSIFGTRTWWMCNIITPFVRTGVPLFFMISGYLLLISEKTLDFMNFYKRRLGKVLIPFLVWNLIYYITDKVFNGEKLAGVFTGISIKEFLNELIDQGSKYHLWFVYTLIGIYLFLPFLKRILDNCTPKQCVWLLFLIMFCTTIRPLINTIFPIYVRIIDPLMEGYFAFFILGYILGKYEISRKFRILIYIGGAAGFFISMIGVFVMSSSDSIDFFFTGGYQLNHFLLASAIFVLFKHFREIKNAAVCKAVTAYSGLTYGIYLIHILVIERLQFYIKTLNPAVEIIVFFLITTTICSIVIFILSKIKYINKLFL